MNIIQELKRPFVFGWVSKELQDKAREIGRLGFEAYSNTGWCDCTIDLFDSGDRLRLKPSYTEKPKVIELEIKPRKGVLVIDSPSHGYALYTDAPVLCPEDGYYFAGFKYNDGAVARNTTRWVAPNGCVMYCHTQDLSSWTIDRPVAALFERGE